MIGDPTASNRVYDGVYSTTNSAGSAEISLENKTASSSEYPGAREALNAGPAIIQNTNTMSTTSLNGRIQLGLKDEDSLKSDDSDGQGEPSTPENEFAPQKADDALVQVSTPSTLQMSTSDNQKGVPTKKRSSVPLIPTLMDEAILRQKKSEFQKQRKKDDKERKKLENLLNTNSLPNITKTNMDRTEFMNKYSPTNEKKKNCCIIV